MLVVKVGGSLLGEGVDPTILEDIRRIHREEPLILVHGGGRAVTAVAERMGKEQRFIVSPSGYRSRYTDLETLEIFTMVMAGKVNKEIVAALQRLGLKALGLSGVDGGLIRAERKKRLIVVDERGRRRVIDGGYTGKIVQVDGALLTRLVEAGYLPVIAPVALGTEYELLNVDGDRAAAYVAGAVKATIAIFLTDVPGVLLEGRLIDHISPERVKEVRHQVGHGMDKKLLAVGEALSLGARRCVIASGQVANPLLKALRGEGCTVIGP
jgi:acetylglutamate/LysW-gamma-L-alpha-aminoadipate kinase